MAVTTTKPTYKATFERTVNRMVKGKSKVMVDTFTDPDDKDFVDLVSKGERGHLAVITSDGVDVHGMDTSAQNAQSVMRGCIKGTYNPFPTIRSKRQEVESPVPTKGL